MLSLCILVTLTVIIEMKRWNGSFCSILGTCLDSLVHLLSFCIWKWGNISLSGFCEWFTDSLCHAWWTQPNEETIHNQDQFNFYWNALNIAKNSTRERPARPILFLIFSISPSLSISQSRFILVFVSSCSYHTYFKYVPFHPSPETSFILALVAVPYVNLSWEKYLTLSTETHAT